MGEYRQPRDIEIVKFMLWNYDFSKKTDIRAITAEFAIFEDIQVNALQGTLVLYDAVDLIQEFPIIGEETIEIEFRVPGEKTSIKGSFRIYKISNRQRGKTDTGQLYVLYFVSNEYYKNLQVKVKKSFRDMPVSKMVEKVFENYLVEKSNISNVWSPKKLLTNEESATQQTIVIPNLNPFGAIKFLADRAESVDNKSSTYTFYEDHNGFHFTTFESFMEQEPVHTYNYEPSNIDTKNPNTVGTKDRRDAYTVSSFEIVKTFDVLTNMLGNMYSGEVLTHDIIRKEYTTHSFDYKKDFEDKTSGMKHLEKGNKLVSDEADFTSSEGHKLFLPTELKQTENNYIKAKIEAERDVPAEDKRVVIHPTYRERFLLKRNSFLSGMNNIVINITIPGDHELVPGNVVKFDMPSATSLEGVPMYDSKFSGKYLITQLKHKFVQDTFITEMELIKDTYLNKAEHKLNSKAEHKKL